MKYIDKPSDDRQYLMVVDDDRGFPRSEIDIFTKLSIPQGVHFATGRVKLNTLYVAHPGCKGLYVPYERYEDEFFLDKMHELALLLQAQGAVDVELIRLRGLATDQFMKSDTTLKGNASWGAVSGEAEYSGTSTSNKSGKERVGQKLYIKSIPNQLPFVPKDLKWYPNQAEWHRMVQQRAAGMTEYKLLVSSESSSMSSSLEREELKGQLKLFSLKLSAEYMSSLEESLNTSHATTWSVNIKFKPLSEYSQINRPNITRNLSNDIVNVEVSNVERYRNSCKALIADGKINDTIRIELNRIRESLSVSAEEAKKIEGEFTVSFWKRLFK